jgi:hypothetical protein
MIESLGSIGEKSAAISDRDEAARLAFIYQESLRGLLQQQSLVEGMNSRAGNLIFAASFASSLLGVRALSDGLGFWDWLAVMFLFSIGALIVFMLWPYYNYTFRFDPKELLSKYVDGGSHISMAEMHRELALRIEAEPKQ